MLPAPNDRIDDMRSDKGISNVAFNGIGQVYLRRTPGADTYHVDLTFLSVLQHRPGGYEKLGAKAVFSKSGEPLEIFVSSLGELVRPGDERWEHAKWVWKTSLITAVCESVVGCCAAGLGAQLLHV